MRAINKNDKKICVVKQFAFIDVHQHGNSKNNEILSSHSDGNDEDEDGCNDRQSSLKDEDVDDDDGILSYLFDKGLIRNPPRIASKLCKLCSSPISYRRSTSSHGE